MKKAILIIFLFFLCNVAIANEMLLVCPSNVKSLSNQIILNWQKSPMPWYSSWAEMFINQHRFIGGMRSKLNKLPEDKDPHLSFYNAVIRHGHYKGEYAVVCVYQIHNPDVEDIADKLYFSHFMTAQTCKLISSSSILCKD